MTILWELEMQKASVFPEFYNHGACLPRRGYAGMDRPLDGNSESDQDDS
jgi:hypothetical protein